MSPCYSKQGFFTTGTELLQLEQLRVPLVASDTTCIYSKTQKYCKNLSNSCSKT